MAHDALGAHARDELGLSEFTRARPIQAALTSAVAFATGALPPLLLVFWSPLSMLGPAIMVTSLLLLVLMGAFAARLGARADGKRGFARRILGSGSYGVYRRGWPRLRCRQLISESSRPLEHRSNR